MASTGDQVWVGLWLLVEAAVDFLAEGPGDGNVFSADMGAMLPDLVDFG
jgi:hypothetical protein